MSFKHLRSSFIFGTQIKIFLMKSGSFLALCGQHVTDTFKAQKGRKDIVKIVHVTSVLQPYEATRITLVPVYCPECVSTDMEQ